MGVKQLGIPFHSLFSYKSGTCKKREAVFTKPRPIRKNKQGREA